jgi:molybdopterin-guanine dinucleotide biosynthesis protein A
MTSQRAARSGLTAVVLAGGSGRRLGPTRHKPLLILGGKLLIARVADTLRPMCHELVLVVRPDQDDDTPDVGHALRMHIVTDTAPYTGPLAAVHAGLAACVTPLAFICGVDHPFLSRRLVDAMATQAMASGSTPSAVVPRVDGSLHPMHMILPVEEWRPIMARALADGQSSPRAVLQQAIDRGYPPVEILTEDEVEAHDPQMLSLLDVDTPEQLGVARHILDRHRSTTVRPDIRRGGVG